MAMNIATSPTENTSRLREPGLALMRPGLEQYRVQAMGSIVIELMPDDVLTLLDVFGGQPGELAVFNSNGERALASLGFAGKTATTSGDRLRNILSQNTESANVVSAGLKRRGISVDALKSIACFGAHSERGNTLSFTAQEKLVCIIGAPGQNMAINAQNPATDLTAIVERKNISTANDMPLPEPLADPRIDMRINARTASAFEVKAGEFIQIIDVAGRECSDFQAFDQRNLDKGIERALDVTTTRTFMAASYPGPGLMSRYYNVDQQPILEIIRDTVGRHDTFGLACTDKYYEDQGYFGHPSCSSNFNHALSGYNIAPRRGWEAVNFFYNTGIDDDNVLYLDEPWSRPGDYVLMQAYEDMVCVSSACPDDTSAANAWNPTDIHLRVYPAKNKFSKAIAYRMKPDAEASLTKQTGFHQRFAQHTRNFVAYKGYWLPGRFNNGCAIDEYQNCRENVAIMDLSALRKFEIMGPDAEDLMQWTATRNVRKLSGNQVVYTAMCYEHGGMFDDGTIFRLNTNNFRWIGGDEYGGEWLQQQADARGLDRVIIKPSTDQIHNVAVQGPQSRAVLIPIIWTPPANTTVEELKWFRFTVGRLHDQYGPLVMVSRTGYSGELGYEIFCHPDDAPKVWDAIWEAGRAHGIKPLGLDALDMLRIEAGLIFADYEFNEDTDPFEAGIGFTVPLESKKEDFLGREALQRRKANPTRKLVGLELQGNEEAVHGDCVHVDRPQIGTITSAMRSPVLNKNIALCRIDVMHSEVGTQVEVGKLDGHQKRIPATVVPFPFYDPKKERVRA